VTTIIGGRINEIRLLFILFPWVIPAFLFHLNHCLKFYAKSIMTKECKLYAVLTGGACLLLYRIGATVFIAGWKRGACKKHMLASSSCLCNVGLSLVN